MCIFVWLMLTLFLKLKFMLMLGFMPILTLMWKMFNHPNHGFNRASGNLWRNYQDPRQITKSLKIKPKWRLQDSHKRMILFVVRIMPLIRLGGCAAIFAYRLQCGWLHWLDGHCLPPLCWSHQHCHLLWWLIYCSICVDVFEKEYSVVNLMLSNMID